MTAISTDDLLHPEILSRETLVAILSQRQIKLDHAQVLNKEKLVDIFHRTVTPLAQREPRANRRGRVTAKKIKRLSATRTFKLDDNKGQTDGNISNRSKEESNQQGGLLISANIPSSKPRLKPPPVVRNRGIIKLNSSSKSTLSPPLLVKRTTSTSPKLEDEGDKKKTVIRFNVSSSPRSPPANSSTSSNKVIRLDRAKSTLEGDVAKISLKTPPIVTKKIAVKRPSAELSGDKAASSAEETKTASSTTSPSSDEDSSLSPKKKIKKITWP